MTRAFEQRAEQSVEKPIEKPVEKPAIENTSVEKPTAELAARDAQFAPDEPREAPQDLAFALAVNSKLNELIAWVVANSPAVDTRPQPEDFAELRDKFRKLACGLAEAPDTDPLQAEPEPEEGGAQYQQVTPAPWP